MKEEPHYIKESEELIEDSAEGAFTEAYCRLTRAMKGEGCTCLNCLRSIVNEYNKCVAFLTKGMDPIIYYVTDKGEISWTMNTDSEVFK